MTKSLQVLVTNSSGGGGGGDGEGEQATKGMLSNIRKVNAEMEILHPILKSDRIEFKKWGILFKEGIKIQRKANWRELNEQILRTTESMADLRSGINKVWGETKNLFELSQTGLIEVTALFEDIAAGQLKSRDALKTTVPTIIEMAERGRMLMGTLGDSAAEIATAFKANRKIVEEAGIDLKRIPFDQQNEILTDILINQRRMGVQGDNREILQSRSARETIEHLQQISFATGKSMKELMKMNVEERKTFEELAGLGIISREQIDTMTKLSQKMRLSGQEVAADFFREALGTQGGLAGLIGKNPGMAMFAGQGNNRRILEEAHKVYQRTDLDPTVQAQLMREILGGLEDMTQGLATGIAAQGLGGGTLSQMMFAARGLMPLKGDETEGGGLTGVAEELAKTNKSVGAETTGVINDLRAWLAANVGPFGDLAIAMALHTPAMLIHAASLFKGGGRGMSLETGKQATSRINAMNNAKNAAKGGRLAAMGRMAATGGRFALAGLGATAGVAGAGLLGWQIGSLVVGPLINAAVEAATGKKGATLGTTDAAKGFFNFIPGLKHVVDKEAQSKTEAEVQRIREFHANKKAQREATAKGVSPVKGINPNIGDPATVAPADAEGRKPKIVPADDPMLVQLVTQNTHLMSIVTLLTTANTIGTDIIDTIGGSKVPSTAGVTPATTKERRNAVLFSDMQSAGALS
jgi:hypothetical protein